MQGGGEARGVGDASTVQPDDEAQLIRPLVCP